MGKLSITPDQFEILVVRELRKVGLEVSGLRIRRRIRISAETGEYDLDLAARLSAEGEEHRVLIGCRHREVAIGREQLGRLHGRLEEAGAEKALLFATPEFERDALAFGRDAGIALLQVVDGRTAHDTGGWGVRGHYPSWLPEHVARVVRLDDVGLVATALLVAGQPRLILDRLRPGTAPASPGGGHSG